MEENMKCKDKKMNKLLTYYHLDMLSPEERDIFEAHLIECEACRKELELTERFFSFASKNREEIIAHLKRKEIDFIPIRKRTFYRKLAFGVSSLIVCVLIICAYYFIFLKKPPPLSEKIGQGIRGENIKICCPVGEIEELPEFIKWSEVKNADCYLIQLIDKDDQIMWSALAHESKIKIPSFIQRKIKKGKSYYLKIKAFSSDGRIILESKKINFLFIPKF